jgi:hypothetical protein
MINRYMVTLVVISVALLGLAVPYAGAHRLSVDYNVADIFNIEGEFDIIPEVAVRARMWWHPVWGADPLDLGAYYSLEFDKGQVLIGGGMSGLMSISVWSAYAGAIARAFITEKISVAADLKYYFDVALVTYAFNASMKIFDGVAVRVNYRPRVLWFGVGVYGAGVTWDF